MTFREELIQMIADNVPTMAMLCEVLEVDKTARTCRVKDLATDVELYDVKLQGSLNLTEGLLLVPKIGSKVVVGIIGNDDRNVFISEFSEIEEMELRGSDYGGLIKIEELRKEIDKNTRAIGGLIDLLKTWSVTPQDGGAALKIAAAAKFAVKDLANLANIENKEVQHG